MATSDIVWLDPSLENVNAGDEIIADAVAGLDLPGLEDAPRLTTHRLLRPSELRLVRDAKVVVVGGTNILNSRMLSNRQWPIPPWFAASLLRKTVFLGVGWWQYQPSASFPTTRLLRSISHPDIPHSVRDSYTSTRLRGMGLRVRMTGCPTMWGLGGREVSLAGTESEKAVVTLTDYHFDARADRAWLEVVRSQYPALVAVTMGPGDRAAIDELSLQMELPIVGHGVEGLISARRQSRVLIGTRLHAAVRWLQLGGESMIVSVDNRATEIAQDSGLPCVPREDLESLASEILSGSTRTIRMPAEDIASWTSAWTDCVNPLGGAAVSGTGSSR